MIKWLRGEKGTADYVSCYQGMYLQLGCYSGDNWGSDLDKHKSTYGYFFFLNNGAPSHRITKIKPCIYLPWKQNT